MDINIRHLIAAYCFTWFMQLGYLGLVLAGWRRLRKSSQSAAPTDHLQ